VTLGNKTRQPAVLSSNRPCRKFQPAMCRISEQRRGFHMHFSAAIFRWADME
jgi:hypothetical protein